MSVGPPVSSTAPLGYSGTKPSGSYMFHKHSDFSDYGPGWKPFEGDASNATREGTAGFLTAHNVQYIKVARALPPGLNVHPRPLPYNLMVCLKDTEMKPSASNGWRQDAPRVSGGAAVSDVFERRDMLGTGLRGRRYTMFSLPAWNALSARQHAASPPKSPEDVVTAQQVWNRWFLSGIVRTEAGSRSVGESYGTEVRTQERVFNMTIGGPIKTFDIWSIPGENNVMANTPLFLIVRQQNYYWNAGDDSSTVPSYIIDPDPASARSTGAAAGPNRALLRSGSAFRPFQIVPFADHRYDYPPLSETVYEDEFGIARDAAVIYVGRSQFCSTAVSSGGYMHDNVRPSNYSRAVTDAQIMLSMPDMFVYVEYKH